MHGSFDIVAFVGWEGGEGAEAVTFLVVLRDSLMKQGVSSVEYSLGERFASLSKLQGVYPHHIK